MSEYAYLLEVWNRQESPQPRIEEEEARTPGGNLMWEGRSAAAMCFDENLGGARVAAMALRPGSGQKCASHIKEIENEGMRIFVGCSKLNVDCSMFCCFYLNLTA